MSTSGNLFTDSGVGRYCWQDLCESQNWGWHRESKISQISNREVVETRMSILALVLCGNKGEWLWQNPIRTARNRKHVKWDNQEERILVQLRTSKNKSGWQWAWDIKINFKCMWGDREVINMINWECTRGEVFWKQFYQQYVLIARDNSSLTGSWWWRYELICL